MNDPVFAAPEERVLPTLNNDGTRRWLNPKRSKGRFLKWRALVGWGLIAVFVALPWIRIGGRPAIWLNLPGREFTFFGKVLLSTDTLILMLGMLAIFVTIFLLTALLGRVWCGWGCPQTVYMEFLYRPVEQALERWAKAGRGSTRKAVAPIIKYGLFLAFSVVLAHTFLAYFVSTDALRVWMTQSPFEHPGPFFVMTATVGLMMFDFAYFREQMCTVICPYARLQSALLDRDSMIVGFDEKRGEPRGKGAVKEIRKGVTERQYGDCIDCGACVKTCPTGIDIRDGLQLECIGCAQCVDACDAIMVQIGAPTGLVRYTSQRNLETGLASRLLRARTLLYPAVLLGLLLALALVVSNTTGLQMELIRNPGAPFTVIEDGRVQSPVRLRIANRDASKEMYTIAVLESDVEMLAPINPFPVLPNETDSTTLFLTTSADTFVGGNRTITVRVESSSGQVDERRFQLLGPMR
ncbi:MAG: cytochrome c oxidase accessory protein CcoG [Myxococcota bacterium]